MKQIEVALKIYGAKEKLDALYSIAKSHQPHIEIADFMKIFTVIATLDLSPTALRKDRATVLLGLISGPRFKEEEYVSGVFCFLTP